jgi:hypothetical protein
MDKKEFLNAQMSFVNALRFAERAELECLVLKAQNK